MQIITFSGVDGSGKSTQLKLLREHLEAQGKRVAYFHAVEFSLANKIARWRKGEVAFTPGSEPAVTTTSWLALVLREKFLLIDMFRFFFLRRSLERQGFDVLLSDRFFYDSVINLEYLARQHSFLAWPIHWGITFLATWTPRADQAFYLDLTPEMIQSRSRVPEQGLDYLRDKRSLFQKRIPRWQMQAIDASNAPEVVFSSVLKATHDSLLTTS